LVFGLSGQVITFYPRAEVGWHGVAAVIEAWPEQPEAMKAGILAMIHAASGSKE
jgi:hypothetical protein